VKTLQKPVYTGNRETVRITKTHKKPNEAGNGKDDTQNTL